MLRTIGTELRTHAPFTLTGAATGVGVALVFVYGGVPRTVSEVLFAGLHPFHVFLSALVTAGMYRLHGGGKLWVTILIGYFGSIGIATLSDSLIPYLGEWLLDLPARHPHLGFIERWYLVNPLAAAGILVAYLRPRTRFPHSGHVLLSTWASLFHMIMALGEEFTIWTMGWMVVFLFLAVWIPCCVSDIVFPLLFTGEVHPEHPGHGGRAPAH